MRLRVAITLVFMSLLVSVGMPASAAGPECTVLEIRAGTCAPTASLGNGEATIEQNQSTGGSGGSSAPAPRRERPKFISQMTDQERAEYFAEDKALAESEGRVWREPFWTAPPPGTPTAPITLADIASFRPVVGTAGMEPNGWMVTGLDTNFFSAAATHVVAGELLGAPAAVRFTPRSFVFDYGDGVSVRTATGGGSWASLGLAEFDPTPTSHVYTTSGTFTIDISVSFGAEYTLDGQSYTAIAGTLSVPAARFTASAGDATTVLVALDCRANPRGPGC